MNNHGINQYVPLSEVMEEQSKYGTGLYLLSRTCLTSWSRVKNQNGKAPQHWSPGFRSKTGTVTLNNVKTELEKKRYFKDLKQFFSP